MIELAENTVVADRFRLVRMIGRGGMGSVWQAVHIGLDTPCALKFIEGEVGRVADAHERFEREAKVSAQLRSPHIVQIIDHGVWQGRPYIAMELLEGTDLGKLMGQHGTLPPLQLNTIIQQVCRALTKAHGAGIVHRDLKPDNIFVTNDDDRVHVKILDFGVAKATGQAIENSNTKTGAMLGTPYYMSPEQAQGIKAVDARSDLWSVAVIVYQCLTGRLPFESEALGDLLVKIIVQPIPVPSHVAPVPAGFDEWWAKAADRNPDHRFQTAKELASSLTTALGLASGMSTPPSVPGFDPLMRTAALAAPPAVASSGMLTPQPHMATFSGVEAGLPKKGMPAALIAALAAVAILALVGGGMLMRKHSSPGAAPSATNAQAAPPPVEKATERPPEIPPPPPAISETAVPSAAPAKVAAATHTAPKPAPAPTASAKKKWDPGF